jgi:hypothetical protein
MNGYVAMGWGNLDNHCQAISRGVADFQKKNRSYVDFAGRDQKNIQGPIGAALKDPEYKKEENTTFIEPEIPGLEPDFQQF